MDARDEREEGVRGGDQRDDGRCCRKAYSEEASGGGVSLEDTEVITCPGGDSNFDYTRSYTRKRHKEGTKKMKKER